MALSRVYILAIIALVAAVAFAAVAPRNLLNLPQPLARWKAQAPMAFSWSNCGPYFLTQFRPQNCPAVAGSNLSPEISTPLSLGIVVTLSNPFCLTGDATSTFSITSLSISPDPIVRCRSNCRLPFLFCSSIRPRLQSALQSRPSVPKNGVFSIF